MEEASKIAELRRIADQLRKLRNLRPRTKTSFSASKYFINYLSLNVNGLKHYANDSMLRVFISLHLHDVSACVRWIRPLTETVPSRSRVHINPSRRFLNLHASHILEGSRPSSREQLRNEGDKDKGNGRHVSAQKIRTNGSSSDRWELTVGIEIHAQLNTERKLFSSARTSLNDEPNSHVSVFDLAFPGSQPIFQKATLLPALRAAIALKCEIQHRSQFDRKHYFYHDQPAGYQITQYYGISLRAILMVDNGLIEIAEPFAKNGSITIHDHEGIAPEDGEYVQIGIKQIQLEQDTAKTIMQSSSTTLLDFNRASHPLIEIITLPQIHYPQTAAACVRKIQAYLQAVNAVTTGMEMGGLRADVNVSVRPKFPTDGKLECHSYAGVTGLGQRTEIKNLSSFKAVEDAIVAERNRQISLLESGGVVEGETRGWSLGSTDTKKLRGKEGEVDYRYLPDPDLCPLIIELGLVQHISESLPILPDQSVEDLVEDVGLTIKDAKTLVSLDSGERLDYYDKVLGELGCSVDKIRRALLDDASRGQVRDHSTAQLRENGRTAANWVLHELGGLLSTADIPFSENPVSAKAMAAIVKNLLEGRITGTVAKELLAMTFDGDSRDVETIIVKENLGFQSLPQEMYENMARKLIHENAELVQQIQKKGKHGKIQWFMGQMMSQAKGKMEASKAEAVLKEMLGIGGGEVMGNGEKKWKEKEK